ncbi:MAG: deoxyribonuclease IV [Deltaproteobacteria bacterium]|nr:deoxyribonuclease IV [Deltaproteobacteria bacterium]
MSPSPIKKIESKKASIGVHLSIAGGIDKSIGRAIELNCGAFQIFSRNPRTWKVTPVSDETIANFIKERTKAEIKTVAIHASYLINLSSPDKELFNKSLNLFEKELEISEAIKADVFVVHPGSYKDRDLDFATKQVSEAIKIVRGRLKSANTTVLIENTAGAGSQTGARLESIEDIIKATKGLNTGLCFDTCHGFVSGYPLKTKKDAEKLISTIDEKIGLKSLKLIHLNDSKGDVGSKLDRHEDIGKGFIGNAGLGAFISDKRIAEVPLILETPKESIDDDLRNLKAVYKIRKV